jgi:nucleoside-diphosphate-sugar epimerase
MFPCVDPPSRCGGQQACCQVRRGGESMSDGAAVNWKRLHGDAFTGHRVLITGGAGFIGSHLAEILLGLGASVVVIDDLCGGSKENFASFGPVEFVEASILDRDALARATKGCRYVFHQAALGSVPRSVKEPRLYNDVNTTGTLNVLEAAREAGVKRVMFAASSSAYGENPVPWIEHMPTMAKSPYAATKVAGEALFRAYSTSYGLDTACLRYFNIFGPRQNANSAYAAVIAAFAKAILAGTAPVIYGDGEQSRDFTFVYNAVHANLLAARREAPVKGEVINVGTGGRVSVNELAVKVAQMLGRPELKAVHEPERTGDIKHSFADLSKAKSLLAYEPIAAFADGLERTLAWYRKVLA